ncbi:N-acetyltransferase domain-containing protein [Mycena kentingensis (nom. inval.)]|nr:N-acetyltransferase domain-containing protein [Mycena kentingensis (nom. inval.)]
MATQYTYSTIALPSPLTTKTPPPNLADLAERYAAIRLEALQAAPHAFASSFALESQLTPEQWAAKVWRDDIVLLICLARPVGSNDDSEELWAGSAVLRGPLSATDYAFPPESKFPALRSDAEETRWQMTAVYTSTAHRGHGLGGMLIQAAKDYAARFSGQRTVRLRAVVHPDNLVAVVVYTRTGFRDVARTTGKEAYRTNGDVADWTRKLASLTSDEERARWTELLIAVVLEWVSEAEL